MGARGLGTNPPPSQHTRVTVKTQNARPRPPRDSVTLRSRSAPRPKASVSFGVLSQETIQGIRKRCGKRIADGTVGRIFQWDGAKSSYVIKATRGDFAQLRKECQSYDLVTRHNMKYVTRAIGYKIFQLTPEIDRHSSRDLTKCAIPVLELTYYFSFSRNLREPPILSKNKKNI